MLEEFPRTVLFAAAGAFVGPVDGSGGLRKTGCNPIEVLYGPQGTLYGRNTTGGEINFVTNRPTADPHTGVTFEYGSFNEFSSEGFVSGSIVDGLKGRLSYGTEQGGGWQYNRLNGDSLGDKDKIALRGQLEFDPTEVSNFRLTGYWSQDKSEEIGLRLLDHYPVGGATLIPADSSLLRHGMAAQSHLREPDRHQPRFQTRSR